MDAARADALAARQRLATRGWIARNAEAFRHLPPPGAELWLGDAGEPAAICDTHPLAGAGWTLHPVGSTPQGRVDARWLDAADPAQRAELFAGLPPPGEHDAAAPFAWAHRALVRHGLRLRIGEPPGSARGPSETVWLQVKRRPRDAVEAPLLVVDVAPGVHCVLVESHERGDAGCRHANVQNLHVHLNLGDGARVEHLRLAAPGADDSVAHHVHARLGRDARYAQALVASGSRYHLQRGVIELARPRAEARVGALLLAAGDALEQQLRLEQSGRGTASGVESLVLASGAARAVVDATTRIAPDASGADARQRLAGIPTGGRPRLVLKPQLEIHHDEVQAAHGATWGALPEDALFYARQRGLDERTARALVVEGMALALVERAFGGPGLPETLGLASTIGDAVARHLDAAEAGRG